MGRLLAGLAVAAFGMAQSDAIRNIHDLTSHARFPQAEAAARALVTEIDKRDGGKDSVELADALEALVSTLLHSSKIKDPEERAIGERALAVSERVFAPGDLSLIQTRLEVAMLVKKDGDLERARGMLEQVAAMYDRYRRDMPPADAETRDQLLKEQAAAWNDLALVLREMDDFAGARAGYERALAIHRERGIEDREVAVCFNNLALVLTAMKDYAGALPLYRRALAIYEKTVGPDHPLVAGCLNNLGSLLERMDKPREAAPLLRRSLAIAEKVYGPDHVRTGHAASNLANVLGELGDITAARVLEDKALRTYEQAGGPDHPFVAGALNGIAVTMGRQGQTREAIGFALRSDRLSREYLDSTVRGVPEREALLRTTARATGAANGGLYTALSLAVLSSDDESRRATFDAVIRDRALVFDEMAARKRVADNSTDPEIARRARELAAARDRLSAIVVKGPAGAPADDFSARLEQARRAKYDAERSLAQASIRFREQLRNSETGVDEVAAALAPGDALIAYVGYRRRPFPVGQPVPAYVVFVLRGGETVPDLISLGDTSQIDAMVSTLRRQVLDEARSPGRAPKRSEAAYRRAGAELRRHVWDPLAPHLRGVKRAFVVADGSLHLVNLAALPVGDAGYLIEHGPLLHHLSSERDLVARASTPSGSGLLAIAGPVLPEAPATTRSVTSGCEDFHSMHFPPLPGTNQEVHEIGSIWTRAGRGSVTELTGASASKPAFERLASGKRVLHLAVHGFFLGENCSRRSAADNPLLLSGLALSRTPDSIITAEEIVSMNLEGVDWAVLSACDTGLGDVKTGEGVFGLRRAFELAGVRTVILSLWPVDDTATREWMTALYRARFLNKRDTAESTRQASLAVLAARRAKNLSSHPFYWAGFLATGDWR